MATAMVDTVSIVMSSAIPASRVSYGYNRQNERSEKMFQIRQRHPKALQALYGYRMFPDPNCLVGVPPHRIAQSCRRSDPRGGEKGQTALRIGVVRPSMASR